MNRYILTIILGFIIAGSITTANADTSNTRGTASQTGQEQNSDSEAVVNTGDNQEQEEPVIPIRHRGLLEDR